MKTLKYFSTAMVFLLAVTVMQSLVVTHSIAAEASEDSAQEDAPEAEEKKKSKFGFLKSIMKKASEEEKAEKKKAEADKKQMLKDLKAEKKQIAADQKKAMKALKAKKKAIAKGLITAETIKEQEDSEAAVEAAVKKPNPVVKKKPANMAEAIKAQAGASNAPVLAAITNNAVKVKASKVMVDEEKGTKVVPTASNVIAANDEMCPENEGGAILSGKIQSKLKNYYQKNSCFTQDADSAGSPLTDKDMGPLTKKWVNQYMDSCSTDLSSNTCPSAGAVIPPVMLEPEDGINPFVLLSDDIIYFALNKDVLSALKGLQGKHYNTQSALEDDVRLALQEVKGMSEYLLTRYVEQIEPHIEQRTFRQVSTNSLDALLAKNLLVAATALESQVDKLIATSSFLSLIENTLNAAYLQATDNYDVGTYQPALSRADKREVKQAIRIVGVTLNTYTLHHINVEALAESAFPAIDSKITDCAMHFVNVPFASRSAMTQAVSGMVDELHKIDPKDMNINCKPLVKTEGEATDSEGGRESSSRRTISPVNLLVDRATKSFMDVSLEPIKLQPSDSCVECSLPLKGESFGFYPYWQASTAYREQGLQTINPAAVDFSLFSRIGYFALPISVDGEIESELHWKQTAHIKNFVEILHRYNVKRDLVLYTNNWQEWHGNKRDPRTYAEKHLEKIQSFHKKVEKYGGISGITLFFDHYAIGSDPKNILIYIQHLRKQIILGVENKTSANFDINLMLGVDWGDDVIAGTDEESGTESNASSGSGEYCRVNKRLEPEYTYFREFKSLLLSKSKTEQAPANLEELEEELMQKASDGAKGIPDNVDEATIEHMLLFLHEPSSQAKKCLRLQVENEFSGENRVEVLRKIIPILGRAALSESLNHKHHQFKDDISYVKNNFGGLGMWPLPLSGVAQIDENGDEIEQDPPLEPNPIFEVLKTEYTTQYVGELSDFKNYMDLERIGVIGTMLHSPIVTNYISVCSKVCPNRRFAIYLFALLSLASVVSFIAFRINCKARKFIIKMRWIDLSIKGASVALFIAMLGCDPFWQPISNGIMLFILSTGIVYFVYSVFLGGYAGPEED